MSTISCTISTFTNGQAVTFQTTSSNLTANTEYFYIDDVVVERNPLNRRETLELVRAYYRIVSPRVRKRVFELVKAVARVEDAVGRDAEEECAEPPGGQTDRVGMGGVEGVQRQVAALQDEAGGPGVAHGEGQDGESLVHADASDGAGRSPISAAAEYRSRRR